MRSVSMRPSATHESGHSYFAQTGHSHFAATLVAISLCRGEQKRTIRESEGGFSMTKFGITVTAFFLLLEAMAIASARQALTKNAILTNRIGPSGGELFIANGDGSGEHKLNSGGNMDYDAMNNSPPEGPMRFVKMVFLVSACRAEAIAMASSSRKNAVTVIPNFVMEKPPSDSRIVRFCSPRHNEIATRAGHARSARLDGSFFPSD